MCQPTIFTQKIKKLRYNKCLIFSINIPSYYFKYTTIKEYLNHSQFLEKHQKNAQPITGAQKFHHEIPEAA